MKLKCRNACINYGYKLSEIEINDMARNEKYIH